MCEKLGLSEVKYAQHDTSRDIGPSGNSRNTAHNPYAINPNEIHSASSSPEDGERDSRLSVGSQVDYSVSKNRLSIHNEDPNDQSLLNGQVQLAADSSSNSTVPSQDESLDSALLSISDSSEQFEVSENNAAVKVLIDDMANKLVLGFRSTTQRQLSTGAGESSGQPVIQAVVTGSSTTPNNSGRSSQKRQAAADDDDDDADQDDFPKPPHKRIRHSPDKVSQRSFACPYLKMDPVKHGRCCVKQLSRIRDVKQHLSRWHTPDRYCQRCLSTNFCDEKALQGHIDINTCPSNDPTALEGISNEQRKRLSQKSKSNTEKEDQWFAIWEILFPRRARPSSVYMDIGLTTRLEDFHEYCIAHISDVVRGQFESSLVWQGSGSTAEQQAFIRMVVSKGLNEILQDYLRSAPSLESEKGQNTSYSEHHHSSRQHIQPYPETTLGSSGDSGIAVHSQFSSQLVSSQGYAPSQHYPIFNNPSQHYYPVFNNGMPNAVNNQFSPQDVSSQRYTPSQLHPVFNNRMPIAVDSRFSPQEASFQRYASSQRHPEFNNGMPNVQRPFDEMMQVPQGLEGNVLNIPDGFFDDATGFDNAEVNFDFLYQH